MGPDMMAKRIKLQFAVLLVYILLLQADKTGANERWEILYVSHCLL
jgi:hypothetical protein